MGIAKVIVTDRVRVPKKLIPKDDVHDRYVIELFEEHKCAKCSNRPERDPNNELCAECPSFLGVSRFFNSREAKEDGVWSLPQADAGSIRRYLDKSGKDFKWVDRRKDIPVGQPFKFTSKLYGKYDVDEHGSKRPNQKFAAKRWLKTKNGIIVARPRSGKTVLATYLYSKLQVKTVIIADQKELLNQFYETACGEPAPRFLRGKMVASDKNAGRFAMTNLKQVMEDTGKPSIFMPDSYGNLLKFIDKFGFPDVLLITYQSFIKDMDRVAKIINGNYSFGIVDEEHGTGADAYLRFIASLDLKYRLGLSATPHRKDGKSRLTMLVLGPVAVAINTVTLKPVIEFYPVKAKPKTDHKSWVGAKAWQKRCQERNVEIVKMAFSDLRKGHNVIIIPVEHKDHMEHLVKMINHQAKVNHTKKGENWPVELAKPFTNGVDRLGTLNWVDSLDKKGKVHKDLPTNSPRVLVAIMKMIKQGVDMKRPSMLYAVIPMSGLYGIGAPMFQQLSFRVATPFPKPQPVVRIFVDNVSMFASTSASLLYNEVLPNSQLKQRKDNLYVLQNYDVAKNTIAARMARKKKSGGSGGSWY
ncbi:ATP-dependent RNA-DNA and DNA-DNA helicase protein [Rhizobium phage RHph_N28_1]|nr:ATP-dependent RNA-DNA and DNA-DNA helicase protein [Rhizobium phage RHph_N28_1]QIG74251.1 ATP-dependent RNA-DNA and DNA-DNA helicase protein [Rhizobium phage RHph_N42]QXV73911.1 ATP-dependent RNA-DNA and DNA-DNA helicase protein [Rhizobium phage RHph_N46]